MADLVTLTIDGRTLQVPKGTLLVDAARKLGIEIPVYCYHPKMEPVGACRVCAVEVPGQRRPIMTACTTEAAEGMNVLTRSPNAMKARAGILEFLLINHPLDCPVCDRGGECDLQDFTVRYGPGVSRFVEGKRHYPKSLVLGRDVVLDRERCIMCQRCVRFCSEISMEEGLTILERGDRAEIGTFQGRSFDSPFSGNTIEICPVGALTARTYRFKARPWELQNFDGVCRACAMGCNLTVDVRYDAVARLRSRTNDAIDDGWLCDRGRTSHVRLGDSDRLGQPLVRRDGELRPATWEEALAAAAAGLHRVQEQHGAEAVGAVAGPALPNEAAWLLLRLMRGLLKSPHVDHRRGQAWRENGQVPERIPASAKISGLDQAQVVVVAGVCPRERMPVLDLRIKKALRKGARLVVVGLEETGLDGYAHARFPMPVAQALDELLKALGEAGALPAEEPPALRIPAPQPWEPGGASAADMAQVGRWLAGAERITILIPEDVGDPRVTELAIELARETGVLGKEPWGLLPLLLGANSRGLREMGVLPRLGPGGLLLTECGFLADAWGGMNGLTGRDYQAMIAPGSPVRALIVASEDPFQGRRSDLEFLVALDLFPTDTAQQADVVLPLTSPFEAMWTATACDGTVQFARQALPPWRDTRPEWRVLRDLAQALGQAWDYTDPSAVFAEIGRLNPLYQGMTYQSFQAPGHVHWSYPFPARLGAPRPDLSAVPTTDPTSSPVAMAPDLGSAVQNVARSLHGSDVLPLSGQDDPRRVAAALALDRARKALEEGRPAAEAGDLHSAQPPGPSPAWRHHQFGQKPFHLPQEPGGAGSSPAALPEEPR